VTPYFNSFKFDDVLPAHMDGDGARFVERQPVEAAEQNVAASAGCPYPHCDGAALTVGGLNLFFAGHG
jgi:hypothetical protein